MRRQVADTRGQGVVAGTASWSGEPPRTRVLSAGLVGDAHQASGARRSPLRRPQRGRSPRTGRLRSPFPEDSGQEAGHGCPGGCPSPPARREGRRGPRRTPPARGRSPSRLPAPPGTPAAATRQVRAARSRSPTQLCPGRGPGFRGRGAGCRGGGEQGGGRGERGEVRGGVRGRNKGEERKKWG